VALRARWTDDSVESFPVFDPESRTLVDHREAIRVSWFVSGGELASDRTGARRSRYSFAATRSVNALWPSLFG
jgi:hypothetical protein